MLSFISLSLQFLICEGFRSRTIPSFHHHKSQILASSTSDTFWKRDIVPRSYQDVEELMISSVQSGLQLLANSSTGPKRYSIDLLTPGLNPKLEQKAMLMQVYLFDLITALTPVLAAQYRTGIVQLAFPSTGDAAGYQKYLRQVRKSLPAENIVITDLADVFNANNDYYSSPIACTVFITSKNNLGDPILSRMMTLTQQDASQSQNKRCFLFINCDLSDRLTTGIQEKEKRENFRNSIVPLFYFRNLVLISRPSLVPIEQGMMLFAYPRGTWSVYLVNAQEINNQPASLNRFMKQAIFRTQVSSSQADQQQQEMFGEDAGSLRSSRSPNNNNYEKLKNAVPSSPSSSIDCTSSNPPGFYLAGGGGGGGDVQGTTTMPDRDVLEGLLARDAMVQKRYAAYYAARKDKGVDGSDDSIDSIDSIEEAQGIVLDFEGISRDRRSETENKKTEKSKLFLTRCFRAINYLDNHNHNNYLNANDTSSVSVSSSGTSTSTNNNVPSWLDSFFTVFTSLSSSSPSSFSSSTSYTSFQFYPQSDFTIREGRIFPAYLINTESDNDNDNDILYESYGDAQKKIGLFTRYTLFFTKNKDKSEGWSLEKCRLISTGGNGDSGRGRGEGMKLFTVNLLMNNLQDEVFGEKIVSLIPLDEKDKDEDRDCRRLLMIVRGKMASSNSNQHGDLLYRLYVVEVQQQ